MALHPPRPAIHRRLPASPPAAAALGADHPLARAASARRVLGRQLAVAAALVAVAAAAALLRGGAAAPFACAALVVVGWLVVAYACARAVVHERACDLIADGGDAGTAEVAAERERLARRRTRERLARSLLHALDAAERWPRLAAASRPPGGVRPLADHAALVGEVAVLVRDPGSDVRGVALLQRLLTSGFVSPLYAGEPGHLVGELARIRLLLASRAPRR